MIGLSSCRILRALPLAPLLLAATSATRAADVPPASWAFTAAASPAYHLRTVRAAPGIRAVVTASLDGTTACFEFDGRPRWSSQPAGGFPFDLAVADLDGDGRDEALVASGDGVLRAYGPDGALRWEFPTPAPLYQVCVARDRHGKATVLTGGVEQVLYALGPDGKVRHQLKTEHCIRLLRAGDTTGDGDEQVAMTTSSSGLTGLLQLFLLNASDLSVRWHHPNLSVRGMNPGRRFFSLLLTDLNRDGKAEVVIGGGWRENGAIHAYDQQGKLLFTKSDRRIPSIPYRMSLLRKVKVPGDEYLLGHFGNVLILYETDGTLRETITGPYSFADSHFDEESKTLFMGSEVSGGTAIYAYRLDQPGWKRAYTSQPVHSRLAEIERNLATLHRQIREFRAPAYQPASRPALAITQIRDPRGFRHVEFAGSITLSQKVDDPGELWCQERDRRMPYKHTADELVAIIAEKEARGENVLVWAGHGDAVFFPLETFRRLLEAGPKHLKGFVFAEMEGTGDHTRAVVEQILYPLAELCRAHGKIVFFRNKNVFWNGTCYLPFWSQVLLNERFRDVFVPGLEETNCRSQELSLAGRIGLWQTGSFNRWACRTVTDDANFNRMFEWGGQQILTHHLRTLVATASQGADIFLSDIHAGARGTPPRVLDAADPLASGDSPGGNEQLFAQLVPFYRMLEQGIVQIPTRENLLSCASLALVMRAPPSAAFLRHGTNGHRYSFPQDGDPAMVFGRLDTYWGGAPLAASDFSSYAMNVRLRTCNFLPELPHGLIPIIPQHAAGRGRFPLALETDGENFFDAAGRPHSAAGYRPEVEKLLRSAAAALPVAVAGPAHWSAVKLDDRHIRLTLVDPGYLDPAARSVEIVAQHLRVKRAVDILSREALPVEGRRIPVVIPAGTFRLVDLELD